MKNFTFFTPTRAQELTKTRVGEVKMGEKLAFVNHFDDLANRPEEFIIIGIPEDIGVRANYGKAGTAAAWEAFLKAFLNIQVNPYNTTKNCLILGEILTRGSMQDAEKTNDPKELGEIVSFNDTTVTQVVQKIIEANKTPIVIGGGHNNAYGIIRGVALGLDQPINVLNIDAHTDLRNTDYRHSGNGFSFASKEGYLDRYAIFGLHQNYTPDYIFEAIKANKQQNYVCYEEIMHLTALDKLVKFKKTADFVRNQFGLEIDCDAVANFASSAATPTGFDMRELRSFVNLAKKQKTHYLHICEAIPDENGQVGKALSYLVSDFIRDE